MFSESGSLTHYSTTYSCADSTGSGVTKSGTSATVPAFTVHDGQTWLCTFTNTAKPHPAPTVEFQKFVPNGLWAPTDTFHLVGRGLRW